MRNYFIILIVLPFILMAFQNCGPNSFEPIESSNLTSEEAKEISKETDKDKKLPIAPIIQLPKNEINDLDFVAKPTVTITSPEKVKVTWTLSDFAQARIEYSKDMNFNKPFEKTKGELSYKFSTHIQYIESLDPGSKYYYRIVAKNQTEKELISSIYSFETPKAKVIPPKEVPTPTPIPTPGKVNPDALFVSDMGNDNNSGSSEAQAFRTIQKGVNVMQAGQTLYVKAGNYKNQKVSVKYKGQKDKPYTIEGYKDKPGDNPTIKRFNHNSTHNSSVMPLIDGVTRRGGGVILQGEYIIFKNFQVTNFQNGLYVKSSKNILVENVIASNLGIKENFYNGHGIVFTETSNSILKNSVVVNAVAEGISLRKSHDNYLEGNFVYCNDNSVKRTTELHINSATDYYFNLSYSNRNKIVNNYIERVGDLDHGGHGFTVKAEGEYNLFESNTAVNIVGGGFVVRHRKVKHNTYRKNTARRGTCILTRDGASENLFEDSDLQNCEVAFSFMDSIEDGKNVASFKNFYKNIRVKNVKTVFHYHWYSYRDSSSYDNTFENIQVETAEIMIIGDHFSKNNVVKNSSFKNIKQFKKVNAPRVDKDVQMSFHNSSCQGCGFQLP